MMKMAPAVTKRTPFVVLLASLSCVVVRGQNTAGGTGSAACPCIQPSTPPVEDGTCVDVMLGYTQLCRLCQRCRLCRLQGLQKSLFRINLQ